MISVCMACYNGDRYIEEQINSILPQLKEDDELIISDDGSTDRTLYIINSLTDPRIRLLNNKNHGVNKNFENALIHAKGDYIFLADQDDVWIQGKVEACLKALKTADCVVHDAIIVDSNLDELKSSFFFERKSGKGFLRNIYINTYLGCCMAFKKDILNLVLPIPDTKAYYHDNWIGCLADLKYKMVFIPFKGILFRRHTSNTSSTARKSNYNLYQKLYNRFIQLFDVFRRVVKSSL